MEPIRIGLMGLGRIGRNLFRILAEREDLEIVAISDKADPATLAYLLRFDTLLGRFEHPVELQDGVLASAGHKVRMLSATEPGAAPWGELGVDVVIEEGKPGRKLEEHARHLEAGAKRVILCVPTAEPAEITAVRGINDAALHREHRLISAGSGTAQAAAPVLKVLADAFGIERAFLTSVHAYADTQRLADVPDDDMRRGRAAAENIIPQVTNAAQVLTELLPGLTGKISALSMNVPVANGSAVDLTCWHEREVSVAAINEAMRTAAASDAFRGVLFYESEPIVSSDVLRSSYSATFDSKATMAMAGRVSKTLSWFDNGWGYAHRVVELLARLHALDQEVA
jgi:glyceraldehyde 3-phosphate dehydrogenase